MRPTSLLQQHRLRGCSILANPAGSCCRIYINTECTSCSLPPCDCGLSSAALPIPGSGACSPPGGREPRLKGQPDEGRVRRQVGPLRRGAGRDPDLHLPPRGQRTQPQMEGDV